MSRTEVDARAESNSAQQDGPGFFDHVWNVVKHQSGIAAVEAVTNSEPVQNILGDFKLVDDGKGKFKGAARDHVDHSLNGSQMKDLVEEREKYHLDLAVYGAPLIGIFANKPKHGPQMTEYQTEVDNVIKNAEKRVQDKMTGQEMQQYLAELKLYQAGQIALHVSPFKPPFAKGEMMKTYEERVLAEIKNQNVRWDPKVNNKPA